MAWECSHDLCNYISKSLVDETSRLRRLVDDSPKQLTILELGCGRAVPSCGLLDSLLSLGYKGDIRLILQDLDSGTIETVTKPNVTKALETVRAGWDDGLRVEYIACSWDEMRTFSRSANIVLSSECIYRSDLFSSHAEAMDKTLLDDGIALVAAKRYYFGCGGGTIDFMEFLEGSSLGLKSELAEVIENGRSNTREILQVHR